MNYSDSERVSRILEELGYEMTNSSKEADLLLFNTCSIRKKAEDRVTGQVLHWVELKKKNPDLLVGLTGCMVRLSSTKYSEKKDGLFSILQGLDFVFRIEDLGKLPKILQEVNTELSFRTQNLEMGTGTLQNYFNIAPKYTSRFQAYVPVMTGCDNFCTFCIVPFSRGRERSRTLEEILREVQSLVDHGCKEITLLGQKVNGYGLSALDRKSEYFLRIEGHPFAKLLRELDAIPGLQRVRFISPHPDNMTDDLIETIGQLRTLCPYVHLPVQSGDNEILKRMNRRYTRERYLEVIEKFRRVLPDISFSTDVIIGFCGETSEQFMNTYRLFEEVRFDMAYISPYSPRRGTVSSRFFRDDVPQEEKMRRFHLLNNLLKQIARENHRQYIGRTVEVLVEKCEGRMCSGRSESFRIVEFPGNQDLIGTIISVRVVGAREWMLQGELIFSDAPLNESSLMLCE